MTHKNYRYASSVILLLALLTALVQAATAQDVTHPRSAVIVWQSTARLRRGLKARPGTLLITEHDIEFHATQGPLYRWPFVEIQTFDLRGPQRLVLTDYENRHWHRSGERRFQLDLGTPMPSAVVAELTERVGKPVGNGVPNPRVAAFATIPARHRTRFDGSNGVLRFRDDGIDYVTESERDARSWRWADIQTLANPDPYHFRVSSYREILEFQLKQPMSQELFDRVWDRLYARSLNGSHVSGATRQ